MESGAVLCLAFLSVILVYNGVQGRTLSREDDVELERQLKILNKPAIKTIKTEYGDLFDCVDIHKQPAFDHPSLKNHKLKMSPSFIPEGPKENASSMAKTARIGLPDGGCPPGYVPIRRAQKQELMKAKTFFNYSKEAIMPTENQPSAGNTALVKWRRKDKVYGTRFLLNVWGPKVDHGQYSSATTWIVHACDIINTGWMVNPDLFGDYRTRLFTGWTADCYKSTGCFNILCPGFVQVDTQVPVGADVGPVSTYKGTQYELQLDVFMDLSSAGDWWLVVGGNKAVGYWPKELFTDLASYSDTVAWGGYVYGPADRASPPMGSGNFPKAGYGTGCFIRNFQLMDMYRAFYPPHIYDLAWIYTKTCYDILVGCIESKYWGCFAYFGGPGCKGA